MGKILKFKHGEGSVDDVDPRLWDIVQHAISVSPYDAVIRSGAERKGGKGNHKHGYAVDVTFQDQNGNPIKDIGRDAQSAAIYEQYAQAARVYQQETYPELDKTLRWGGGFKQGAEFDFMHLDITPGAKQAMAYYDWDSGFNDAAKRAIPGLGDVVSGGLGDARTRRQIELAYADNGGLRPSGGMPSDTAVASETDDGIVDLQRGLAARGFSPGRIDGDWGPKTEAAVRAFQKANGLKVDGIVGPKTAEKLNSTAARPGTQAPSERPFLPLPPPAPLTAGVPARGQATSPAAQAPNDLMTLSPPSLANGNILNPLMPPTPPPGRSTEQGTPFRGRPAELDVRASVAPSPMGGRPASMDRRTSPVGAPTAPTAPTSGLVRLASGKMIAPGIHPGSNGQVRISDDGSGNAVVTPIRAGLMGEAGKPTVVGGLIRSGVAEAIPAAGNALMEGTGNAVRAIPNVVSPVADWTSGVVSGAKANLGGLWNAVTGQAPTAVASEVDIPPQSTPESRLLSLVSSPTVIREDETRAEQREQMQTNGWRREVEDLRHRVFDSPNPMSGRPAGLDTPRAAVRAPSPRIRPQAAQSNALMPAPQAPGSKYSPTVYDEVGALRYHG